MENCKPDGMNVGNGSDEFEVQVLKSSSELLAKLQEKCRSDKKQPYPAMYSSIFGGIVLDPAMMLIPIDDHMVHRGHGVFDTAVLLNGYIYELDRHLDRFLNSASKAKISSPFPRSTLRSILVQLAAAAPDCKTGSLRYWLSSGPGDFLLSPIGCPGPALYAVVIASEIFQHKESVRVVTARVAMKPPQFATMKNVNYLPNVLTQMEAEEKGAFGSVWVDEEGFMAEGPNMNLAFVTRERELIVPWFDKILPGCTVRRLVELAPKLVEAGRLSSVRVGNVTIEEARGAAEMMYVGSTLPVLPIVQWDDKPIGDGKVGELTMELSDLVWGDMVAGPESHRTLIPYRKKN